MGAPVSQRLGFIGAGAMATAIMKQLVASGYTPSLIMCSDIDLNRCRMLSDELGIQHASDNTALAAWADFLIVAVKPHVVPKMLPELAATLENKPLVSIAAGVTTANLLELAGSSVRVLRVMPNTPAQIGCGVTTFSSDHTLHADELALARHIFESVGAVVMLEERLMNAATALAGSGPALPYLLIETMADAGVRMGIPRATALALATQTVIGAAMMQKQTGEHPAKLRDDVCSPGGSTIEMVAALERCGFQGAIHEAVWRCKQRVDELG